MPPTMRETMRINGSAEIADDPEVCKKYALRHRIPKTVLRITVKEVFSHRGKAVMRAG